MKKITIEPNDEISQYQPELDAVMDALRVDPEIRDGYWSDESLIGDLFDALTSRDEIAQRLLALELTLISPSAPLIQVLREIRRLGTMQ